MVGLVGFIQNLTKDGGVVGVTFTISFNGGMLKCVDADEVFHFLIFLS